MNREYFIVLIVAFFVLVVAVLVYNSKGLLRTYKKETKRALEKEKLSDGDPTADHTASHTADTLANPEVVKNLLTLKDIEHLPLMVRNYLTYACVVGKEKVHSFKMVAEGEIKMTKDSKWGKIKIEQKNFVGENLVRLFYLTMNMFGIPVYALHSYTDKEASMLGKIAGLITVIDIKGKEMRISDTITLLNDMCLVAPATLIDSRITWQEIDNTTVKAIFKTEYCTVSANLYFNEKNQLINFTTDERYYAGPNNTFEKVKWSTPFYEYKSMNGIMLPSKGEATWSLPEGDYTYCKFTDIRSVEYNIK